MDRKINSYLLKIYFTDNLLGRLCVQGTCTNRYGQCGSRLSKTSYPKSKVICVTQLPSETENE